MEMTLKLWCLALFAAPAHTAALPLAAQGSAGDPGWLAWLGCWEPADSTFREESPRVLMCVIPGERESAVRILKVWNGAIESEERMDATGEPVVGERDGCRHSETAEWSADGMRLYLTTEYECPGEEVRRGSGVLSIAPGGDWLDVRAFSTGDRQGVSVIRYREVFPAATAIPEEIRLALEGLDEPRKTAREIMGGRLFAIGVIEAARRLDTPVTEAWLVERGLGFEVSRREIIEMESAGVPVTVIDLMVGLSYPHRFAVNRARRVEKIRAHDAHGFSSDDYYYPSHYGYASYSGYGWYPGGRPFVVVVASPSPQPGDEHGKVVKGKGYKQAESSSSETKTVTTENRRTESSSSSSSSSSKSSSSESSSSSSNSERTAKPRP